MMETYTNNTRHCCCGWIYNQEIIRNQFVTIGQRHRCGVEKKRVRVHRPCALVSKLSWKLNDFSWLDDAIHHVGNSRHFVSLVNSQRKSQSFVVDARLLYKYVSSWLLYKDEASYFLLYSLRFYSNHLIHSFLTIPQYKKIRAAISAFSAVESIKAAGNESNIYNRKRAHSCRGLPPVFIYNPISSRQIVDWISIKNRLDRTHSS